LCPLISCRRCEHQSRGGQPIPQAQGSEAPCAYSGIGPLMVDVVGMAGDVGIPNAQLYRWGANRVALHAAS
jgi:hypothetical protein